jgi:hypothetical protein
VDEVFGEKRNAKFKPAIVQKNEVEAFRNSPRIRGFEKKIVRTIEQRTIPPKKNSPNKTRKKIVRKECPRTLVPPISIYYFQNVFPHDFPT